MKETIKEKITRNEKLIADYQKKLKENPSDSETAITIMTLQVAVEELKNELEKE